MTESQLGELAQIPVEYDELSGLYAHTPDVPLEDELAWVAERLRAERTRITAFLDAKALVEHAVLRGAYETAIAAIDRMQKAFGVTLWSVQLRLALEQEVGGLEGQKRYAAIVRAIYRHGLLGFVTYHSSVRNESRTTLAKFLDDIENRIDNHRYYSTATKIYARYRLKNEFPASSARIADILSVEQNHGVFDLHETFVATLQELAGRNIDPEMSRLLLKCIAAADVSDFRLLKIGKLLDPTISVPLPERDYTSVSTMITGDSAAAALIARHKMMDGPDPWQWIYAGFAFAHGKRQRPVPPLRPTSIPQLIGRIQSRCAIAAEAWSQTAKLALNYRGLSVSAGLLEFLNQIRRSTPDAPWRPWLIGLNSPYFGIEDVPWNDAPHTFVPTANAAISVWQEIFIPNGNTSSIEDGANCLARAAGCIHRQDYTGGIAALGSDEISWPEPLRTLRALLLLHAHFARGERCHVIELIAREGARSPAHLHFLPVVGALKDYEWDDFKKTTAPLAAPIALHLLWSAREDALTASRLRFATGMVLKRNGVERPSLLPDSDHTFSNFELIYFLNMVCVQDILDLSRLFKGTRAIIEERQAICRKLEDLDPENAESYRHEIIILANQLALDEGQRIVDGTRIHVDSDALARWAMRELAEDFDRYRALELVSVDEKQTFEDVLNELSETNTQKSTFSPDNEADAVLVSILKRMGEEFLSNATFGLDFYLSKRVRHQSFIGLIRGPLEFSELITTRESELGEYHRNDTWIDRFQGLDDESRDKIDVALRLFSKRFDDRLADAKDKYFHIRSIEHPEGMIILTLNERLLTLSRAVARLDPDFPQFLRIAVSFLWAGLEPSLASVRRMISDTIKTDLVAEFDKVRATVRGIGESDPALIDFDTAMGKGSAEVQIKLDEAVQWFVHAPNLNSRRTFTLAQILKIGLDAALKTQRGYTPRITQAAQGDLELQPANLVFIHDVLFVGLGNAHKHSGLKSPEIDVRARWDAESETLAIEVISDCRSANRLEKAKHAAAIRKAIAAGSATSRTRTEGGSGFAKLAAVINQNDRAKLEFGFTQDGRFRLEVTYAVILRTSEALDAA